ncbi:MAG TPA: MXAN_5187 C-terminal domain-containing protein [Thermoanaerobaculia bacterium]|nr:MXAN_5187 C-terminal domain-containing protein [Thermoanaerobaculia bacterium]
MPFEREFQVLEEAIRRLTAEYDAFLYGGATRPPVVSRKHVDQMIRKLSTEPLDAAADRYRLSTLQGRYTAMLERWDRLQAEKESGRRPGLYGHFGTGAGSARASSAGNPAPASKAPNAPPPGSVEGAETRASGERGLFQKYLDARKARGESVEGYEFDHFAANLAQERARLKEKLGTDDVVFDVAERDGKVKLVARRAAKAGGPSSGGKP